jgi:hypothetical protein
MRYRAVNPGITQTLQIGQLPIIVFIGLAVAPLTSML